MKRSSTRIYIQIIVEKIKNKKSLAELESTLGLIND